MDWQKHGNLACLVSPKMNSNQHQIWTEFNLRHFGCPSEEHACILSSNQKFKPEAESQNGNLAFERI